jgi:hypothetical protein
MVAGDDEAAEGAREAQIQDGPQEVNQSSKFQIWTDGTWRDHTDNDELSQAWEKGSISWEIRTPDRHDKVDFIARTHTDLLTKETREIRPPHGWKCPGHCGGDNHGGHHHGHHHDHGGQHHGHGGHHLGQCEPVIPVEHVVQREPVIWREPVVPVEPLVQREPVIRREPVVQRREPVIWSDPVVQRREPVIWREPMIPVDPVVQREPRIPVEPMIPVERAERDKWEAFKLVKEDNVEGLRKILSYYHYDEWSRWQNHSGRTLLELAESERERDMGGFSDIAMYLRFYQESNPGASGPAQTGVIPEVPV